MSDTPGEHLTEEPQAERGPMGSRDTGSDEPAAGRPTGRPARSDEDDDVRSTPRSSQTGDVRTCRPVTAAEPTDTKEGG